MKKLSAITIATALTLFPAVANAAPATPKLNAPCSKVYQIVKTSKGDLRCENTKAGKKVWKKSKSKVSAKSLLNASMTGMPLSQNMIIRTASALPTAKLSETITVQSLAASYPVIADPNNGGSSDVPWVDPALTEQPNDSLPDSVTGLTANVTTDSVQLTFTPISGISTYQVYLRYGDSYVVKGVSSSNPNVSFDNLTSGWNYTACVYYFDNSQESEKSCSGFYTHGVAPTEQIDSQPTRTVQSSQPTTATQTSDIETNTTTTNTVEATTTTTQPAQQFLAGATNVTIVEVAPGTVKVTWDYTPNDSSQLAMWTVGARHETSYTTVGVDPTAREFTISGLSSGAGYEIFVEGFTGSEWTSRESTSVIVPAE